MELEMETRIFLRVLLVTIFIFGQSSASAWASNSELQELKSEIRELKETVKELKTVVQVQNQRIEELEKSTESEGTVAVTTPPDTSPTPAPKTYKQFGFWEVPVNPQGPSRFLPDISVNGVFAAAYFTDDPGEVGHNPSRTGLNLQEIELAIQSVIDPYVRADIFLSFHEDGVELEEGYITTLSLPRGMQIKAGKYLMPFGRQNPKHLETWPFVNNMLVNQELLGPEGFNELGVQLSYLFPTPFFFLAQGNFSQGDNENNFDGDRKQDFAYSGRLSGSGDLTENLTLLMGTSFAFGFNNTGNGNATNLYGGDLLLRWQPSAHAGIQWQTEYIYRRRQVPFGVESEGGIYSYLMGNWSKRWGTGFRVDYVGIPKDMDATLRLSPMVVFRPTEFFQVKAQYDLIDDDTLGIQQAAFLQWIFTMGPHSPHPF